MSWLADTLAMVDRKITATLTGETVKGFVSNCCLQRCILLTYTCEAWL